VIPASFLHDAARDLDGGEPHAEFAAFVRARCESNVEALHGADLYLAFLALRGRDDAVRELEQRTRREATAVTRGQLKRGASNADLAQQAMLALLYGGPDGAPKLAQYGGRAPLGAWLRVVVMRLWERGSARDAVSDNDLLAQVVAATDEPELAYLKHAYRAAFKTAFTAALGALSFHDRMLLRQHYLDELGIDELARLHRVHRATAARWLATLREKVLADTQRALAAELPIDRAELAEVMELIKSRLEVSISRLLA
jgi:RNA polymerase sigma-70 factor (ECF subfamily)